MVSIKCGGSQAERVNSSITISKSTIDASNPGTTKHRDFSGSTLVNSPNDGSPSSLVFNAEYPLSDYEMDFEPEDNDDPYGIHDFLEARPSDVVDEGDDFDITLGTNPDDLENGVSKFITSIPANPTEDAQNDSDRTWTTVVEELQKIHAHEIAFNQQRLDRVINDFDSNLKRQKEKQTMREASIETLKAAHDKEIASHKSREETLVQENEELWGSCTEMMKDLYASNYNNIMAEEEEEEDEGEEDETLPTDDSEERLKDAHERIALLEAQNAALESDKKNLATQLSTAKRDANNMRTLAEGRKTQAAPSSESLYQQVINDLNGKLNDEKQVSKEAQDMSDCAKKSLRRKIDRYDTENQQLKQKAQGLQTELDCVKSTEKYWNQDFWMSCVRKYAQLVKDLSSEAEKLENNISNMGQRYGAIVNPDHELHVLLNDARYWTRAFDQIGANAFPSTYPRVAGSDDDDDDMFGDGPATGNNYNYYHREDSPVTSFLNGSNFGDFRGNSSQDQAIDVGGFINPELAGEDDEAEPFMKELLVEDPEEESEEGSEEEDPDDDGSLHDTPKVDNHQTTNIFGHKNSTTAPPAPPVQSFSPPPTSGFGFSVTSNNPFSANTTSPPPTSPFNFSVASTNNGNASLGQSTSVPQKSAFDFSITSRAAANPFSVDITSSQSTRSQFHVSTSAANDSSFSTSIEDTSTTSPTQLSNSPGSQEDASAEAATPAPNQDAFHFVPVRVPNWTKSSLNFQLSSMPLVSRGTTFPTVPGFRSWRPGIISANSRLS